MDDIVITREDSTGGGGPWIPTPDPSFVPGGAVSPTETPVTRARGTGDVAALTFDDGPNPGETEALLDYLAERDLTATFCVIGQNITAPGGAELLRRDRRRGPHPVQPLDVLRRHGLLHPGAGRGGPQGQPGHHPHALGDPTAEVPYFRAPNGSWGVTPEVAVALGMQPLGLGNVIFDWDGNDLSVPTLTANLRGAITPGAVVLGHDGGGDRTGTVAAVRTVVDERLAEGFTFTLPQGGAAAGGTGTPGGVVLSTGFEDGLDGWVPRGDAAGDPTVAVTTAQAHAGAQSALVSGRTSQGDGIGHDVTGLFVPGTTYEISRVGAAAAPASAPVWLSMQRTGGGATSFDTVAQFPGITSSGWTQVTATYQLPPSESAFLYLETAYPDGTTADLYVDDIVIRSQDAPVVEDLLPLKDTVDFPVGRRDRLPGDDRGRRRSCSGGTSTRSPARTT